MPASDPREREKTDQLSELARVMEMAVGFFRLQLKTGKALTARAYLESRRLKEATQDQFEIGYALDEWSGLLTHLRGEATLADAVERAVIETRQYAKRQMTWFRHQMPDWFFIERSTPPEMLEVLLAEMLRRA